MLNAERLRLNATPNASYQTQLQKPVFLNSRGFGRTDPAQGQAQASYTSQFNSDTGYFNKRSTSFFSVGGDDQMGICREFIKFAGFFTCPLALVAFRLTV